MCRCSATCSPAFQPPAATVTGTARRCRSQTGMATIRGRRPSAPNGRSSPPTWTPDLTAIAAHDRSVTAAAAAAAGLAAGVVAIASPQAGLLLATAGIVAVAAARCTAGALAAALAAYLPYEGTVASHLPALTLIWVRYAPEAIVAALCLIVFIRHAGRLSAMFSGFGAVALLVLALWAASAIANGVPLTTALLGVRAELRYLPL